MKYLLIYECHALVSFIFKGSSIFAHSHYTNLKDSVFDLRTTLMSCQARHRCPKLVHWLLLI